MKNSKDEKASGRSLSKNTYCITIKDDIIDKKSINDNKYLMQTLSSLIKKRLILIYISIAFYIIHVLSFIVCTYRVITDQCKSASEFIIVFGILLGSIVMLLSCFIFCKSHYITLQYNIDEPSQITVNTNNSAFEILSQCNKLWGVNNYKVLSYSNMRPIRQDAQLQYKSLPWYLKSNLNKCYHLDVGGKSYYFLPDKLIIESKKEITSVYYSQIDIKIDKAAIVETEKAPRDAMFIRNTWEHTNNNGEPDKHYKTNRQIPEYLYGVIHFCSSNNTNLKLVLYVSNIQKGVDFMEKLSSTNIFKERIDSIYNG